MKLSDFDFKLPSALIARYPNKNRTHSRLLVAKNKVIDSIFYKLGNYLKPGDLLVLNDTKVMPARLYAKKETGTQVEILIERIFDNEYALAMMRANRTLKINSQLILSGTMRIQIIARENNLYRLKFIGITTFNALVKFGHIPIPPYLNRCDEKLDIERYQSVFAKKLGAIAAPTAGLHFDKMLLKSLKKKYIDHTFITLHIGSGTFTPIRLEHVEQHKMHSEYFAINQSAVAKINKAKLNGGRIVAVGTTVVRALESACLTNKYIFRSPELNAYTQETDIFIYPGFDFKIVDAMISNFHLPKSSLLILVSAFAGYDNIKHIYQHAISQKYRFFSYGDAMLLFRKKDNRNQKKNEFEKNQ